MVFPNCQICFRHADGLHWQCTPRLPHCCSIPGKNPHRRLVLDSILQPPPKSEYSDDAHRDGDGGDSFYVNGARWYPVTFVAFGSNEGRKRERRLGMDWWMGRRGSRATWSRRPRGARTRMSQSAQIWCCKRWMCALGDVKRAVWHKLCPPPRVMVFPPGWSSTSTIPPTHPHLHPPLFSRLDCDRTICARDGMRMQITESKLTPQCRSSRPPACEPRSARCSSSPRSRARRLASARSVTSSRLLSSRCVASLFPASSLSFLSVLC